ncbi:hypothetical protein BN949_05690 [Agrobacterium tumefaciens]|nr:hypothetical protein BN949_05690 [Agrobacterium tumefaciens]
MIQDDAITVDFCLSVMRRRLIPSQIANGLPDIAIVEIVIAQDQSLSPIQSVENLFGPAFRMAGKIAQVPNDIVRFDNRIPSVDNEMVHLVSVDEG